MKIRRDSDAGRHAVSLLATALVILFGAVATAFMVVTMTERATWKDWVAWGSLFGGVALLIWNLHTPADKQSGWKSLSFWLSMRDRTDPLAGYTFRRRKPAVEGRLGTNQPPTLESLRESSEAAVKWVPHGPPPERKPRRKKPR